MKKYLLLFCSLLIIICLFALYLPTLKGSLKAQQNVTNIKTETVYSEQDSKYPKLDAQIIHVVVALCDNKYQAIAPVPAKIGNGQDPFNNLYWGAAYGVKTFMKKQPEWQLKQVVDKPVSPILERLIFKHKSKNVYLIADAYDGQYIKDATQDFMNFSAGIHQKKISYQKYCLYAGGDADLVVYVGHNFLMEHFVLDKPQMPTVTLEKKQTNNRRQSAVFACQSHKYFAQEIKNTGTTPLITTMTNMAPEAYSLNALINGWVNGKSPEKIHEDIAQAYNKYQKSGVNAARKLFAVEKQ